MRTYNVYTGPNGEYELVKQGWSWPAFLFTFAWALRNGFWGPGLLTFIPFPTLTAIGISFGSKVQKITDIVTCVGILAIMVLYGRKGNEWRGAARSERGFVLKGVVSAESAAEALAFAKSDTHSPADGGAAAP